ncbi:MAG: T9SS type A sorting domain-containing protein [Flavobacteriaceae bacterium]
MKKSLLLLFILLLSFTSFTQTLDVTLSGDLTYVVQPGETINYELSLANNASNTASYNNLVINGSSFATSFTFSGGDINNDNIINPGETWLYFSNFYVNQLAFDNNGIPVNSDFIEYEVIVEATEIGGVDLIYSLFWQSALNLTDTDGDGVIDLNETNDNTDPNNGCEFDINHVTRLQSNDWMALDCDNDSLSNEEEFFGNDPDTDGDNILNINDVDDDNDGVRTILEAFYADEDGDNLLDHLDQDADGDSIPDNVEAQSTFNYVAPSGIDADNDGLDDAYIGLTTLVNSDDDNINDLLDSDSDNDGHLDINESGLYTSSNDVDNDGLNDGAEDNPIGFNDPNGVVDNPLIDLLNTNGSGDVDYREAIATTCSEISDLSITNITEQTASLYWLDNNTPTSPEFLIKYGATGFDINNAPNTTASTQTSLALYVLSSNTTYDVYIKALCNSTAVSNWFGPISFTTLGSNSALTCNDIFEDSNNSNLGNNFYDDNENITTTISPLNTGDVVTVDFASFDVENQFDGLMIYDGPDTTFPLIDSGSTYNRSTCPNGAWTGTNSFAPTSISATNTSGALTFVFTSDASVTRAGWEASISCNVPPTCFGVTNLEVTFTNHESAVTQFTDNNSPQATAWEIEYGVSGFTQGTGTVIQTSALTTLLTGLSELTTYDVYVRADCGSGDYSTWSNAIDFSTESTPLPTPICGEIFTDNGGANNNYSNNEDSVVMICPDVTGEVVTVQFTSFNVEVNFDSLKIYDGEYAYDILLGEFDGTDLPPTFTSTSTNGCLTFVFESDNSVSRPGWEANVICGPPPTCVAVSNVITDNITPNSASLFWQENNDPNATNWEIEYGESGFIQGTGTLVSVSSIPYDLSGLAENTVYDYYIRSNCGNAIGDDDSLWTFGIFETPNCEAPSINSSTSGTYSDFLTIGWLDNNMPSATSWEVEYGLMGFTEGTGTLVTTSTPTYTMTGRDPYLSYEIHVRSVCTSDSSSAWSIITFPSSVPCDTPIGDAFQSFNSSDNPTIADLQLTPSVTGETITIFTTDNCNGTPLLSTDLLVDNEMYYAFQGDCCVSSLFIIVSINQSPVIDYPYNVDVIPFQIYTQPLNPTTNLDDYYTSSYDLDFNFNFFGFNYNQVAIGTNSVISFDVNDASSYCPWNIDYDHVIPSTNVIDNAILGVYQDFYDYASGNGSIGIGHVGTAPFRKFVVFFDEVSLYNSSNCGGLTSSNQMVLYESYNFIDVQVKDRNVCTSWNEGNAILGIQNIGGTEAYFPADRNVGDWDAHDEGYRFKPELDVFDFQYIICDPEIDGVEVFDLNVILANYTATSGITYSIHATKDDAENNTNALTGNYTNTSNSQVIYLREENSSVNEISIKNVLLATIDCNADYDLDTVDTTDEDLNGNGNYGDDDTDGDAIPDFIDEDDDGDFVLTTAEAIVTNNRSGNSTTTTNYLDTDGDQIPNYLDNDDDGDGVLTINEDYDGDMNPGNDDTNGDGILDYLQQSVALGTSDNSISNFSIFPNPVKNNLTVQFDTLQQDLNISIYNVNGQEVYQKQNIISGSLDINVSQLSSGVYFINVMSDDKVSTQKFVKE